MEAVPRLPMLSFDLKVSPESTSFGPKLKQYIRDFYHEDPEMYSSEIHNLEGQRATAVCAVRDVTGCTALKRYYCQLHFLQSRFPMAKDGSAAVPFTWRDTYANMVCTLADIRFEMVSILYNIGALHSQLGASDSRVTADGMKLSCTHFQCAAWSFQHLKDSFPQPAGVDLAPDVMQFMYHLSLAQAQECILEKSMMDNRKSTIIAKVAVQIVDYYNLALNVLEQGGSDDCSVAETVGSKLYKNWKRYVKFKIAYHSCVSLLYQGQQAEEQQKMGERVAYYQAASEKLEEAMKLSKGMDNIQAVNESLTFTMDVVEGKKKAAKNENEFIYHEEIPDKDSLPDVKGASLVKGIPFNVTDPEVSGPDIFARLVPMKAHEAASLYSEEKAKLLRRIGVMVDEKDQELVTFMTSLQLDHLNVHSEPDRLPQELVDRCAALSAKPNAIQNLVEAMNKLADTYHDVEGMLQDIKELIQIESTREKEYQDVMGKRPPSIVATDLTREANKYQEAHAKASESNQTLHKAMTLHISNLKILSQPLDDLQKHIPTVNLESQIDENSVKEMQHLVGKVEEMKRQRAMLATQLRESTCQDDITHLLVTHTGESQESLFNQELQKHHKYVSLIEQNLTAQESILKALTEAYARYAGTRRATNEAVRKRETTINALISSYDAYEDLLAKSSKGLEFYRKLETNVNKLLQRVKGTCKVQEEEREQILAKNNKSVSSIRSGTEKTTTDPEVSSSSAPKLKDYLHSMKQGNTTGAGAYVSGGTGASINQMASAYYNTNIASYGQMPAPVASPQPSHYYDPSASYNSQAPADSVSSQQMVPAVRPAPVGSEGTSEQTTAVKFDSVESEALKHQKQVYSYISPNLATQQSTVGGKLSGYPTAATTYSSSTQYNYSDITSSYPVATNSAYLHQQRGGVTYAGDPAAQRNATGYNTQIMQQYDAHGNITQGYTSGNVITPGSAPTSYTTDTKSFPDKGVSPKSYQYGSGVPQQQIYNPHDSYQYVYQTHYPANSSANYTNIEQKSLDAGSYYMAASTSEGYNAGVYTSTQLNYPSGTNYQTPAVTSSQPHHLPSSSVPYTPDAYQYNVRYPNSQKTSYSSQNHPQTQQTEWQPQSTNVGNMSTVATTLTATTSTATVSSGSSYYGSAYPNTAVTSLSNTVPVDASVSNSQYYGQQYQQYQYPYSPATHQIPSSKTDSNIVHATTEFQYATPSNSSYYTNAGNCDTSQTCSSQTSIVGHTFAAQYEGISSYSQVDPQTSYYSLPYGYQYSVDANGALPVQNPQNFQQDQNTANNNNNNQTQANQMTYMQACGQNNTTTTTYSQQGNSSLSSSSSQNVNEETSTSNVDLLAGLDFSLNQAPLVPQQPSETSVMKKEQEQQQDKPSFTPVQQILSNLSTTSSGVQETPSVTTKTSEPSSETASITTDTGTNQLTSVAKECIPDTNQEEGKASKLLGKDPYTDTEALNQFVQEVGKYEKFVEGLTTKTLNGPTPLDMKWKELLELQEKDAHKRSISVARCYPMKNRFPDILPYDHSRIELPSTKDDYINASYVKNLTPVTPPFIITQSPLPSTYSDFWTMVWEQQVEVIVCLLNDTELQGQIYWPLEKGQELAMGKMKLTLQSSNVRPHWIERIVSICIVESRATRVIVHLQLTTWPGSSFPASPGPFLSFVSEALNFYSQQRVASHPVIVHCLSGVGRTGLFCLVAAAVCEIQAGHGLLDLVTITALMSTHRKGSLRDREHLKFAYQAVLYYAQDLLMKRGILTSRSTFEDKRSRGGKSHTRHPSEDFLLGPPTDLSQLQSGIEKMGLGLTNSSTENQGEIKHFQTYSRKSSVSSRQDSVSSISGSRSSSPGLYNLSSELSQFSLSTDGNLDTFRRASQGFSSVKTKGNNLKSMNEKPDDPLNQLDPLWPLKRL